jgi:hypothetical protein
MVIGTRSEEAQKRAHNLLNDEVESRQNLIHSQRPRASVGLSTYTAPRGQYIRKRKRTKQTCYGRTGTIDQRYQSEFPFPTKITLENDIVTFLEKMGCRRARHQFHQFRNMQGPFVHENRVWELKIFPILFSEEMQELAPELSWFAMCIFHTPGMAFSLVRIRGAWGCGDWDEEAVRTRGA